MERSTNIDVHADVVKNRLYITFTGSFNDEDSLSAMNKTLTEIKKMRPGFSVITDISHFKPATAKALERIQVGQQAIAKQGVRRIIRIVDRSHITGQMQFLRMGKQVYDSVDPNIATSVQEAEAMLDNEPQLTI
jgi:hypothetical protein